MKDYEKTYNSVCEQIDVSSDFKDNISDRIFQRGAVQRRKTSASRKRLVTLAAAVLAVILFAGSAYAVELIRRARMSDETMFSINADKYTMDVSQSVEHEGLRVSLSEVFFENNKLYILVNFESCAGDDIIFISPCAGSTGLRMDGQNIPVTCFSTVSTNGDISWLLQEYDFSEYTALSGTHDFILEYDSFETVSNNGESQIIHGPWSYSFTLDVSSLDAETTVYNIGRELALTNGDIITIDFIICSPLSQRLCYTIIPAEGNTLSAYRINAYAADNLGNIYEFTFHEGKYYTDSAYTCESVNILPDNFSADAQMITLNEITVTDRYDNVLLTLDEPIPAYQQNS